MKFYNTFRDISNWPIILWVLCLGFFSFVEPMAAVEGGRGLLSFDVFGYYIYLPTFFIEGSLTDMSFGKEIMQQYNLSSWFYQAWELENGNYVANYPIGMALLLAPFFLLGHFLAWMGGFPMDGFSIPYRWAVHFGCGLYVCLGIAWLRRILLTFCKPIITSLVLFIILFATNLFNYTLVENTMPHGILFTGLAGVLYFTIQWHKRQSWQRMAGLALCLGLSCLSRPTALIAVLVPLFWGVYSIQSLKEKMGLLRTHYKQLILLFGIMLVCAAPQLLYWKIVTDQWVYYSYQEVGFNFKSPNILRGLVSWRKGWLVYTPIMLLALIGFLPLFKNKKSWFVSIVGFFLVSTYVIFSWENWWYGGGYSARAMVDGYALLAIPMALLVGWLWKRKALRYILLLVLLGCTFQNLMQTYQYRKGMFSTEGLSRYMYLVNLGKTSMDRAGLASFEGFTLEHVEVIGELQLDEEGNLIDKLEGVELIKADASLDLGIIKPTATNEVGLHFIGAFDRYIWNRAQFVYCELSISNEHNEQKRRETYNLQSILGPSTLSTPNDYYGNPKIWMQLDLKLPIDAAPGDVVKVRIVNPSGANFWIKDWIIE